MRSHLHLILYYLCTIVISGDKEAEEEGNRKRIIEQLTRTRTVLFDDYHLVTRQIATDVYMYRSYRTVSVVFYPIMRDVTNARFTFQSEELHLNNIGSCDPQEVIINIKHGSYPAVNPDGYDFPKKFIDPSIREPIHTLELLSDAKNRSYIIQNPKPGNWYALVYIKWEDPRTQKVEQQGLVADCQTILYTDLQVQRDEDIELIDCYSPLAVGYEEIPAYFKCMSLDNTQPISIALTIVNSSSIHTEILFHVQSLAIPTEDRYLLKCAFDPKEDSAQLINFIPHPNAWHYIYIDHVRGNASKYADCESYLRTDFDTDDTISNHTLIDLMRDDKGRFFTFDYGLPTTDLQDATSLVNLTSGEIKTLRFKVNQFLDIGGSLAIEASLLMSLKYYMGYRRELKKGSLLAFSEDNQFIRAVICLDIGHASIPLRNGRCKYNDREVPAFFVLNSTDSESIYDKAIIPFPDAGTWHLTFRLFCDDVVCPCPTSDNGTKYYVRSELDKDVESDASWNQTREGTSECNATVVLSISSTSCVSGRCSNHGSCLLNTFGGLVMSFCSCTAGYGGWDCSDDSRMDSRVYMLVSVLLLTLSNLLFFLSIEFRSREEYYSVQSQKLQAEVNAHLYSVSQRLPHLSYSPLGRHNEWDKHDPHKPLPDSKESNSSDSLEKSVMGSNLSSCSNQTASSSLVASSFSTTEPITSGGSSSSAISPPLPGSSGSTASSSTVSSNPVTCIYLMSRTAIMMEMSSEEVPSCVTAARFLSAVLATEELGFTQHTTRSLAQNVFALWMCSPLLEIQLKPHHCPWRLWCSWQKLVARYGHASPSRRARDQPVLRLQRNVFFPKQLEEGIKDSRIQELLYEEARHNVVTGRYPLESAQAVMLGGLQARIQLGPYDPHRHNAKFFREHQDKYLPQHARSGRWAQLLPAGRKGSPEAKLLEQAQRPPAAPPRKLRHKYLAHVRTLPTYGAAFFQGQIEQPVRSLTSLLTHEDIPVLVAVNSNGVYVIDDTESTVLLGLLYEELSWDIGLPSDDNEDSLPCLFLQFMVVENGLRVSKILQVFSKQAIMMDTLIEHFAGEYRKRLGQETPSDHANYDYHSDSGSISLPPLSRPDSPQRRLANKFSRLALATHDGRGNLLGGAGDWNTSLDHPQPSWILPKH